MGVVLGSVACEGKSSGRSVAPKTTRLVSLAPALTQVICELGGESMLVGVGEYDFAAPYDVRVVGHFKDINTEVLLKVRPTHLLAMYSQRAAPSALASYARSQSFRLVIYDYPRSVADVSAIIFRQTADRVLTDGADVPSVAEVMKVEETGRRVHARLHRRLNAIAALTRDRPSASVLMVFDTAPITAIGRASVLDDLLVRYVGARNAAAEASVSAPTFDREKLLGLKPDVILLLRPKDPPFASFETDPRVDVFRDLPIPAVENRRIALIRDPLVLLPGAALPSIAAAMAKAVYPELGEQIDAIMAESDTLGEAG